MYEYKVIEIREKMMGGKMSGSKLEQILNENARQGWQLKAITSADVKAIFRAWTIVSAGRQGADR